MNSIGRMLLFLLLHSSFCFAWQITLMVGFEDTQLQDFSLGIQDHNAWIKKIYADKLLFSVGYNKKWGMYYDAALNTQKHKRLKNNPMRYAAEYFSLALIHSFSASLKEFYKNVTLKNETPINIPLMNEYNKVTIPFESTVNNIINSFVAGIVPREAVKEVYDEVQKALMHAQHEHRQQLDQSIKAHKTSSKLIMVNGTLRFYDATQERLKKIKMLEKLTQRLKAFC